MTKSSEPLKADKQICVGTVTGPHGLKGDVKIKSFTENPRDVAAFGPVTNKSGKQTFNVSVISANQKGLVAELSGVRGREAAEAIRGLDLYIPRDLLPELDKSEFYYSDLIGLRVEDINGEVVGVVILIDNYGAGEIMEVNLKDGRMEMFQMSQEVVPEIDLKNGRIVVNPPTEVFVDENQDREVTEEG